jgi:hypothetical protein
MFRRRRREKQHGDVKASAVVWTLSYHRLSNGVLADAGNTVWLNDGEG